MAGDILLTTAAVQHTAQGSLPDIQNCLQVNAFANNNNNNCSIPSIPFEARLDYFEISVMT
jgi:hypothetical protein